jgi:tRNA dimethylallyltransferase
MRARISAGPPGHSCPGGAPGSGNEPGESTARRAEFAQPGVLTPGRSQPEYQQAPQGRHVFADSAGDVGPAGLDTIRRVLVLGLTPQAGQIPPYGRTTGVTHPSLRQGTLSPAMDPILAILGPTATGKSTLAMAVAGELGGEIVNADALQVYRGLDIGTAKPCRADRERVPHHLIDILEPHEVYSAGEFARRAKAAVADIQERGRIPIVVGGSGLYLRALFSGISPVPPGDPEVRRTLREQLEAEGLAGLREELGRLDPPTAARLSAGDTQRVLRALEVARVSGRPLSSWVAEQPFGTQAIAAIRVGLTLPRGILYDQIAGRVARMMEAGWLEEVEGLLRRGLSPRLPAFQAIGYRQLVRHLEGDGSLEQAVAEIVKQTRRFAKRQETWFRKEPDVTWFSAQELKRQIPGVLEHAKHRGLGRAYG